MKFAFTTMLFALILQTSFGQKSEKTGINFSNAIQIDSSDYFLIPRLIDSENEQTYGKGKGYLPWGHYSDIIFYNTKTNQSKKLFNGQLALITPYYSARNNNSNDIEKADPTNFLPKHLIYLARIENFSGDNALDMMDPLYLFISSKTGDNLKQITPKGFNVVSWTVSADKKIILVKGQNDKNGNKKFGDGDDDIYYRVDLNDDISKIQCYLITL